MCVKRKGKRRARGCEGEKREGGRDKAKVKRIQCLRLLSLLPISFTGSPFPHLLTRCLGRGLLCLRDVRKIIGCPGDQDVVGHNHGSTSLQVVVRLEQLMKWRVERGRERGR